MTDDRTDEYLRSTPCAVCGDTGYDPGERQNLYWVTDTANPGGPAVLGDAPMQPCPECNGMRHPASRAMREDGDSA